MNPSPSVSISAIIRVTSSDFTEPMVFSASPSSVDDIFPSPFASKRLKMRSSCAFSSASPIFSVAVWSYQ
uniref:Uncharacterized protein n=1 Tax=Kalanchoe fedtschenkoi TaxID=63787 RepID=A0A7N1A9U1_KALFE